MTVARECGATICREFAVTLARELEYSGRWSAYEYRGFGGLFEVHIDRRRLGDFKGCCAFAARSAAMTEDSAKRESAWAVMSIQCSRAVSIHATKLKVYTNVDEGRQRA